MVRNWQNRVMALSPRASPTCKHLLRGPAQCPSLTATRWAVAHNANPASCATSTVAHLIVDGEQAVADVQPCLRSCTVLGHGAHENTGTSAGTAAHKTGDAGVLDDFHLPQVDTFCASVACAEVAHGQMPTARPHVGEHLAVPPEKLQRHLRLFLLKCTRGDQRVAKNDVVHGEHAISRVEP